MEAAKAAQCDDVIWLTADKTKLAWKDMTIQHLRNSAKMVKTLSQDRLDGLFDAVAGLNGDAAVAAAEAAIDNLTDTVAQANAYAETMLAYTNWRERYRPGF